MGGACIVSTLWMFSSLTKVTMQERLFLLLQEKLVHEIDPYVRNKHMCKKTETHQNDVGHWDHYTLRGDKNQDWSKTKPTDHTKF